LCAQPDAATCISKLVSSPTGLASLQSAMRSDLSPKFFNGSASDILTYLQAPELQIIGSGDFLNPVVLAMVEPPTFWNAFCKAFQDNLLEVKAQTCFAWLLLQLVSLPGLSSAIYRAQAREASLIDKLGDSASVDIRTLFQKIQFVVTSPFANKTTTLGGSSPGGRHDNDFVDFREIEILPTADELSSNESPFLRTSDAVDELDDGRLPVHLDNQFRLLREDMLYEIREELQIATKTKKKKRRALMLDALEPIGLHVGQRPRRVRWGIQFSCNGDFSQLKDIEKKNKKKKAANNRNGFQQESLAALLVDGEIVAFPLLILEEALLRQDRPVVVLQFQGQQSMSRVLFRISGSPNISLVQINTAIFAYEPVLRALQRITTMHLETDLLYFQDTPTETLPPQLQHIVRTIRSNPTSDLQSLLRTKKSVKLDESQAQSLLSGLTQRVALIQGPPGMSAVYGALDTTLINNVFCRRDWKIIPWRTASESPLRCYLRKNSCCLLHSSCPRRCSLGLA
jgi:hypothetical protein